MAIRFHGTEGDVIPRSALVESLHHVLDRKDLADLVIPDLARWKRLEPDRPARRAVYQCGRRQQLGPRARGQLLAGLSA